MLTRVTSTGDREDSCPVCQRAQILEGGNRVVSVQRTGGVQRNGQLWPEVETKQDNMHVTFSVKLKIQLYIEREDTSHIQRFRLSKNILLNLKVPPKGVTLILILKRED